jgi:poly-gamma-glutamate synthesis protein (capsule biosynthesis protein)
MARKSGASQAARTAGKQPVPESTVLVASDWAPIRAFDPIIRRDPLAVYGDMLPILREADLRIVNCECALTSARKQVWKSGAVFKGDPGHIAGLTAVPFEVVCLANNHVFDYGVPGFRQSLDLLHRNGIRTVGAGLTEEQALASLTLSVGGTKVSVINISEGEDLTAARGGPGVCGWDLPGIVDRVRDRKDDGSFVIVIAHCGLEYIPFPPPYVVSAFRTLVDAGAGCVVGHHPHVPQGIEWYQGRPIVYSLGNFVFYQHTDLYYRKLGFCVSLKLSGNRLTDVAIHPYFITDTGLRRLPARERARFLRKLTAISRPLNAPGEAAKAWQAYLAYYGVAGFSAEVGGILERMKSEPEKGAAMFRNRVTTLQHVELWRDLLTRVMAGEQEPYSRTAHNIIREWFTRKAEAAGI